MSNKFETYANRGLTGLANLGNTCYVNSCIQILSHCYIFNDFLNNLKNENLNNNDDSVLLKEWINLKNLMWSKNCTIAPNRFINSIHIISKKKNLDLFSGFIQNDLPEFLIFLIDTFHNSLKRDVNMTINGKPENNKDILAKECYNMMKNMYSNNYSEIIKYFYGIQVSLIKSYNDNSKILSVKSEPFCIISLPLIENKLECSLYECLDLFSINELLNNDNAWYNEKTMKKEDVYKSLEFWSLPEILIIDLKRFNNYNRKINTLVNFPLTNLDLSKYILGYSKETYIYNLFGICNHSGNCNGGHYFSYIKNANNKWYSFNDTHISVIHENKLLTNKAYCLFFMKQ